MLMPMGIHKGKPIDELPTMYLAWLVSQDAIRFSRWPVIEQVVKVLGERFGDPETLLDELRVTQPPAHWKTAERTEEREKTRAEKLRQLEQRRLDERLARREPWRVARDQADMQRIDAQVRQRFGKATTPVNTEPTAEVLMDASYFVRKARLERKADTDVSDLI